jgi:hypothetical protein
VGDFNFHSLLFHCFSSGQQGSGTLIPQYNFREFLLSPHLGIFPLAFSFVEVYLPFFASLSLSSPEAEFLGEIQTKVLKVSHLVIHSHHYSFALGFVFLQTHATSYSFLQTHAAFYSFLRTQATSYVFLQYSVKEKGEKTDRKPYPLPHGFRKPEINLKSKNSQYYAQKPQGNCTFMNSASEVSFGKFENIGKIDLRGGVDISRAGVPRAGFCAS